VVGRKWGLLTIQESREGGGYCHTSRRCDLGCDDFDADEVVEEQVTNRITRTERGESTPPTAWHAEDVSTNRTVDARAGFGSWD